jgi:hypothetical protein
MASGTDDMAAFVRTLGRDEARLLSRKLKAVGDTSYSGGDWECAKTVAPTRASALVDDDAVLGVRVGTPSDAEDSGGSTVSKS